MLSSLRSARHRDTLVAGQADGGGGNWRRSIKWDNVSLTGTLFHLDPRIIEEHNRLRPMRHADSTPRRAQAVRGRFPNTPVAFLVTAERTNDRASAPLRAYSGFTWTFPMIVRRRAFVVGRVLQKMMSEAEARNH